MDVSNPHRDNQKNKNKSFYQASFLVPFFIFVVLMLGIYQLISNKEGDGMVMAIVALILFTCTVILVVITVGYGISKDAISSIKNYEEQDVLEFPGKKALLIINILMVFSFLILCVWVFATGFFSNGYKFWYLVLGSFFIVFIKSIISLIASFRRKAGASERILPWIIVCIGIVVALWPLLNFISAHSF